MAFLKRLSTSLVSSEMKGATYSQSTTNVQNSHAYPRSFLRLCHFFRTKETVGKRLKVNLGIVSSFECIIWFAHAVRVNRALFSSIPQRNLPIVNADINIGCRFPTNISAVVKVLTFSKCPKSSRKVTTPVSNSKQPNVRLQNLGSTIQSILPLNRCILFYYILF